jgi:membrane fusion protein, macrolide-specific efflux system
MVLPRRRFRGLSALNLALVAVVLGIGTGAYLLFFRTEPAAVAARPSVQVALGEVTAGVTSSGTLQSSQTASPQFQTSGTVTAVLVKTGQTVTKGTALARIDPAAAERQVRIAEQNQIAAANSVSAAQETLSGAMEAAKEAEDAAEETPAPTGNDATNPGTAGQAQTETQKAVSVTNARAGLARARADKEQADQDLEAAHDAVAATTLRAPIGGTVTAVNGQVGSVTGGPGGQSNNSGTSGGSTGGTTATGAGSTGGFVDIANLKSLQVVASFAEADAVRIKAKQSATVTLNAQPGSDFAATLTSVSPVPVTTNGVVSYAATFTLRKSPPGARIGQTANVSVQTAKVANALYVPSTAVTTTGTTHTVTLADGGGTREVQIGVRGDSFTQITAGLTRDDRVELIQGPIGGATGAGAGRAADAGRTGFPVQRQPGQFPGANRGR